MRRRILHFGAVVIGLSMTFLSPRGGYKTSYMAMYPGLGGYRPPAVAISSPTDNTVFIAPANVTIYATASDVRGKVTRVDFYRDSDLIGTDADWPYSYTWRNAPAGEYRLTVAATNDSGVTKVSPAVKIAVRNVSATGCTCAKGCDRRESIKPPFAMDGVGEFCWETYSLGSFVISWKLDVLEINGVNMRNRSTNRFPPKINGRYFIYYKCSDTWGHFEIR